MVGYVVPASRFRRGDSYVVHTRDVYLRWEKRMTVEPQLRSPTKRTKTEILTESRLESPMKRLKTMCSMELEIPVKHMKNEGGESCVP